MAETIGEANIAIRATDQTAGALGGIANRIKGLGGLLSQIDSGAIGKMASEMLTAGTAASATNQAIVGVVSALSSGNIVWGLATTAVTYYYQSIREAAEQANMAAEAQARVKSALAEIRKAYDGVSESLTRMNEALTLSTAAQEASAVVSGLTSLMDTLTGKINASREAIAKLREEARKDFKKRADLQAEIDLLRTYEKELGRADVQAERAKGTAAKFTIGQILTESAQANLSGPYAQIAAENEKTAKAIENINRQTRLAADARRRLADPEGAATIERSGAAAAERVLADSATRIAKIRQELADRVAADAAKINALIGEANDAFDKFDSSLTRSQGFSDLRRQAAELSDQLQRILTDNALFAQQDTVKIESLQAGLAAIKAESQLRREILSIEKQIAAERAAVAKIQSDPRANAEIKAQAQARLDALSDERAIAIGALKERAAAEKDASAEVDARQRRLAATQARLTDLQSAQQARASAIVGPIESIVSRVQLSGLNAADPIRQQTAALQALVKTQQDELKTAQDMLAVMRELRSNATQIIIN